MTRKCGGCAECCTAMRIEQLDKPAGESCPSLRKHSRCCTIYETRPAECAAFECAWLAGLLPSSERPDRTGVVVSQQDTGIVIHETEPGGATRGKAWRTVSLTLARGQAAGVPVWVWAKGAGPVRVG